jgi:threonine dehydratase
MDVTFTHVLAARARIVARVRHTPLDAAPTLGRALDADVRLKLESEQVSGSFKARGAFNKILTLRERGERPHVIAPTAGGHGIGMAWAARALGVPADVFLPRSADPYKIRTIGELGASVHLCAGMGEAKEAARAAAREPGRVLCSAFDDPQMIEAGGTVALEILDDAPDVDCVVVGVGGGGLIAGMGIVLKAVNPRIRLIGVQPASSAPLAHWHAAGRPVPSDESPSFAEGIGAHVDEGVSTWPYVKAHVDDFVLVTDDELRDAMAWALLEQRRVIEGAGAAAIAGLRKLGGAVRGMRAVGVVTGGNVDSARYLAAVGARLPRAA